MVRLFRVAVLSSLMGVHPAFAADPPPSAPPVDTPVAPTTPPEPPPIVLVPPLIPPAVDVPPPITADELDKVDDTIIVISDPFSRWEGTRWFIKTEVGLPVPLTFLADSQWSMYVQQFQIRTILACDKDEQLSKRSYQIHCKIEDFGLQAVEAGQGESKAEVARMTKAAAKRKAEGKAEVTETQEQRRAHIQEILSQIDTKLSGADVQLQVAANGRVTNIDLEGVKKESERENAMFATLRLLIGRMIVGFDMRLSDEHFLEAGIWTEYSSQLMTMPDADASQGTSMLIHKLEEVEGHLVVESRGRGVITLDSDTTDQQNSWITGFAGVAVYDSDSAYMTERVWVLKGDPTSDSYMHSNYWHAGRIVQLKPDQKPSVGETRQVSPMNGELPGLPAWTPLEL